MCLTRLKAPSPGLILMIELFKTPLSQREKAVKEGLSIEIKTG
jgi:hypothetical protein